jgi:hypothetical protein
MTNITLTDNQIKRCIYTLLYQYQSFGNDIDANTANDIAVETEYSQYFDGIVLALGIVYPIPEESEELPIP